MIPVLSAIFEDRRVRRDIRRIARLRGLKVNEFLVNRLGRAMREFRSDEQRAIVFDVRTGVSHGYHNEPCIWIEASHTVAGGTTKVTRVTEPIAELA
jgi:hypothetical protein